MVDPIMGRSRVERLEERIAEAHQLIDAAIEKYFSKHEVAARCLLFSGGNDSTTMVHLLRGRATHAVHVNTGIGIEQTRQFVRDRCQEWELPLLEKSPPPGSTYEELVLEQGFPGPGHHFKMYQRLKERALREVRGGFVSDPRKQRVLFIAGRRRDESARRQNIVEMERDGSTVWVSPLVNWTNEDLNTYRALHDVPRNEVSDLIHMSGECLCGAFAKKGELDEIGMWFPEVASRIRDLESRVAEAGLKRCTWGWGSAQKDIGRARSGMLCSSCDVARQLALGEEDEDG